ncbi:uncharacterized protein N7477_002596 [Penicillium maclennaniae]|uniref:uncharacterized protein n=1 Tax=Penicillium maclennaniae TaxID=1343394 RepID=UPI002540736A|nr:uncharacterized protein N7477_002596 [Penicillium maclennaniae]KAJ5676963.1 hypothetical protein N7477_002596 [Penicillium maclennaniae]
MTKTIQDKLAEHSNSGDPQLFQYVGTVEAYDNWTKAGLEANDRNNFSCRAHDTDGNIVQRLDTFEMWALLPQFLDKVTARFSTQSQSSSLKLVDFGCGTGRNTIQLLEELSILRESSEATPFREVVGLDVSPGILEVARSAIQTATLGAVGVISTLVLEYIPAKEFFEAAAARMLPGAYLMVTNMHADMGAIRQARFTDPQIGIKIRPTSYCHSVPEVLAAAEKAGFKAENLLSEEGEYSVLQRAVDQQLGKALGAQAKKWVGIKVWFGVCFSKIKAGNLCLRLGGEYDSYS